MPRRFAVALTAALVALALPAATAGAASVITPLPGGFGSHCGTGNFRKSCVDILDNSAAKPPELFFHMNKTYCSTRQLMKGQRGVAYDFFQTVIRTKTGFKKSFTYHDYQNEGNPGSVFVAFTITGRYTSPTTLRVVIKGKVTKAYPIAADCAKVKFTEVHILKHI